MVLKIGFGVSKVVDLLHLRLGAGLLVQLWLCDLEIKANFGTGQGRILKKGRKLIYYLDRQRGYNFLLRARDLTQGKDLIREILTMNGDTLDTSFLKVSETLDEADAYPYNPGTQVILGKRKSKPRRRPLVNVRFKYAYATVHGYNKPIYLYSKSSFIPDALVQN